MKRYQMCGGKKCEDKKVKYMDLWEIEKKNQYVTLQLVEAMEVFKGATAKLLSNRLINP